MSTITATDFMSRTTTDVSYHRAIRHRYSPAIFSLPKLAMIFLRKDRFSAERSTIATVSEREASTLVFDTTESQAPDMGKSANRLDHMGSRIAVGAFAAVFLLIATVAAAQDKPAGTIRIDRAASHSMVPGAKVGDGYLTITNTGSEPDRLIGARSERAKTVQLHQMSMDNGIMTMRELKGGLPIPAGETIRLEPNYHLMFQDIAKPFKQDETVRAVLVFEKAGDVEADFVVGKIAGPLDDVGAAMHGGHEGQAQ